MSPPSKYCSVDPCAATIGAERGDYREILLLIEEDLESTLLIEIDRIPTEFRQYGLPVWVSQKEPGIFTFKRRVFGVTLKMEKENETLNDTVQKLDK